MIAIPRTAARAVLDVIYPPLCLHCGARIHASDVLCAECIAGMMAYPCTEESSRANLEALSFASDARMMVVGWEFESDGAIGTCIQAMKYRGLHRVGAWLGGLLGERLRGTFLCQDEPLLVPVPLHRIKRIERGYNQAEALCRGIARETGLDIDADLLRRGRYTVSQAVMKLDMQQRRGNVLDAFHTDAAGADAYAGRPLIVVDDLITTGATMGACAAALRERGFAEIRFLAAAQPPRQVRTPMPRGSYDRRSTHAASAGMG